MKKQEFRDETKMNAVVVVVQLVSGVVYMVDCVQFFSTVEALYFKMKKGIF